MSLLDLSSLNLLKFGWQIRTDSDKPVNMQQKQAKEEGVRNDKELLMQLLHFRKRICVHDYKSICVLRNNNVSKTRRKIEELQTYINAIMASLDQIRWPNIWWNVSIFQVVCANLINSFCWDTKASLDIANCTTRAPHIRLQQIKYRCARSFA